MIPLVPQPAPAVAGPLNHVLRQAIGAGSPPPELVVVEDAQGEWLVRAAAERPVDRARAVVAVASEEALRAAVRLGFGGAVWLPPSTTAVGLAMQAAAERPLPAETDVDPAALSILADTRSPLLVATWAARAFWRKQLGDAVLASLLGELGNRLSGTTAFIPWPALLIAGLEREVVSRVADDLVADRGAAPTQGLEIVELEVEPVHTDLIARACCVLAGVEKRSRRQGLRVGLRSVHRLPTGELLGHWHPPGRARLGSRTWIASPGEPSGPGFSWLLRCKGTEDSVVPDIVDSDQLRSVPSETVRLAGWVAHGIRPGSPAGLLTEALARTARRAGKTLWVPNVDASGMQLLLGQRASIWIDGPVVPGD